MIQSLLIKLAMLAMTMGVVFWIGWQAPRVFMEEAAPEPVQAVADVPAVSGSSEAGEGSPQKASPTTASAATPVQRPVQAPSRRTGPLDLNRASAEEIDALPGVGAVLAQRVIAYRKSAGEFLSIDDLRRVKGIGAKKLARLRPLIMVSPAAAAQTEKTPL